MQERFILKRTRREAILDLYQAEEATRLHWMFFKRMQGMIQFIAFLSSSTGIAALVSQKPIWSMTAGALAVLFAALDFVLSPAEKSAAFQQKCRQFGELIVRYDGTETIDTELEHDLIVCQRNSELTEIQALKESAYNRIQIQFNTGIAPQKMGRACRLLAWFASA